MQQEKQFPGEILSVITELLWKRINGFSFNSYTIDLRREHHRIKNLKTYINNTHSFSAVGNIDLQGDYIGTNPVIGEDNEEKLEKWEKIVENHLHSYFKGHRKQQLINDIETHPTLTQYNLNLQGLTLEKNYIDLISYGDIFINLQTSYTGTGTTRLVK